MLPLDLIRAICSVESLHSVDLEDVTNGSCTTNSLLLCRSHCIETLKYFQKEINTLHVRGAPTPYGIGGILKVPKKEVHILLALFTYMVHITSELHLKQKNFFSFPSEVDTLQLLQEKKNSVTFLLSLAPLEKPTSHIHYVFPFCFGHQNQREPFLILSLNWRSKNLKEKIRIPHFLIIAQIIMHTFLNKPKKHSRTPFIITNFSIPSQSLSDDCVKENFSIDVCNFSGLNDLIYHSILSLKNILLVLACSHQAMIPGTSLLSAITYMLPEVCFKNKLNHCGTKSCNVISQFETNSAKISLNSILSESNQILQLILTLSICCLSFLQQSNFSANQGLYQYVWQWWIFQRDTSFWSHQLWDKMSNIHKDNAVATWDSRILMMTQIKKWAQMDPMQLQTFEKTSTSMIKHLLPSILLICLGPASPLPKGKSMTQKMRMNCQKMLMTYPLVVPLQLQPQNHWSIPQPL
ncbi:hypothetical protein VP01_979g1 [Puccinia sorghi]|uniref:Uncharacterized protein n=1 Tax=Puccinia sorghi TaxID=27349 RepID=A0A0L6U5R5_9BASI|nr:hypothetical protein VP01_979g1 [Puccinia sorghi]